MRYKSKVTRWKKYLWDLEVCFKEDKT